MSVNLAAQSLISLLELYARYREIGHEPDESVRKQLKEATQRVNDLDSLVTWSKNYDDSQ